MLHVLAAADSPKSFRAGVAVVVSSLRGGATPVVSAVKVAALEAAALGASAGASSKPRPITPLGRAFGSASQFGPFRQRE